MKQNLLCLAAAALLMSSCGGIVPEEELEMPEGYYAEGDILHPKEVCNHLTGEVRHGSFRWTTEPVPGWTLQTGETSAAEMKLTKENPKFQSAPNNLKVTIEDASTPVRLVNSGYWGMNLVKDDSYLLRVILRTSADYKGKITALLLSDKDEVLALAPAFLLYHSEGESELIKSNRI